MDKALREQIKQDKFVREVGHSVQYVSGHRKQTLLALLAGVALLAAAWGVYAYRNNRHVARQGELKEALRLQDATVGPGATDPTVPNYPTEDAKRAATTKAWTDLAARHSGAMEGTIAHVYLGTNAADRGNLAEAERHLRTAIDDGDEPYVSQAKLSLSQVLASVGKNDEAEKILRGLMQNPTVFVSKEQATISLARLLAPTKPAEARKLLEPLRSERGNISRLVLSTLSELPPDTSPAPAAK